MEKFTEAKKQWFKNETEKKERIRELRQQLIDANADIKRTNTALAQLRSVRTITYDKKKFTREPHLYDFYTPSKEMKQYAVVTSGVVSGAAGWGLYKFLG